VKKSLVTAMDKQAYERELVSKLLSSMYNIAVTPEKIAEGFQAALDSLEDIIIDTPDAVDVLSKFLARAIFDEIVAPAFLKNAEARTPLAEQCVGLANGLLNQPYRSERLAHIWGAGDMSSVKRLKEAIDLMFEEFLSNSDTKEADHTVRDFNARYFHPHLVKQGVRKALSKGPEDRKKILDLLAFFTKEDLVSLDHLKQGLQSCYASLEDIKLDAPNAPTVLSEFIKTAKADGWLDSNFEPN